MTIKLRDTSDFNATNVNQNLVNQVNLMDKYAGKNDFNITIHFNAFNKSATGAEVWYYAGDNTAKAVAEKMSKAMADTLGIPNRGAKPTTNLYVVSQSIGHTLLLEVCFIDNASDAKKWASKKDQVATALINVMNSYPGYNFFTVGGGHHGKNMFDPGAVGNGYKEAVEAQYLSKKLLNYKSGGGTSMKNHYTTGTQFKALRDITVMRTTGNWENTGLIIHKGQIFNIAKINTAGSTTNATLLNDLGRVTLNMDYVSKVK